MRSGRIVLLHIGMIMPNPQYGDKVWLEGETQPNGHIVNIDWHDKEVHVRCYDTGELHSLEWDQFDEFNYRLNQWIIRGRI